MMYMAPLLDSLRTLGGSAKPAEIISAIAKRNDLDESVTDAKYESGASKFEHQVRWARQYLFWDGYIDGSKRGVWALTDKGQKAIISEEDALQIYKNVSANYPYSDLALENQLAEDFDARTDDKPQYWIVAPGEGAKKWDEFRNGGLIGIGWDKLEDLNDYNSRDAIKKALLEQYPNGSKSRTHTSLALWDFAHKVHQGDILIAKKGTREYLGYGIVQSDYFFDDSRDEYKHLRKVVWKKTGSWAEDVAPIVTKTLTNISKYPTLLSRLQRLIGIEQEAVIPKDVNYWWLNANPKYWRIEDFEVGQEQFYTTHNEKGNKRNRFEYFQTVKPGDLVIGYASSPVKQVVAVFEISKAAYTDEDDGKEKIAFIIQKFLPTPVTWSSLEAIPALKECEVLKNNQGSLFKLSKAEFNAILSHDGSEDTQTNGYGREEALQELFMGDGELEKILSALAHKQNIILKGPPGTGKTFMARRLAYARMEEKDPSKIEMVQFHQSYSYEDFVQGYRPKEDASFRIENGVFYRFCKRAQADPDNDYFFIIDEINRGNLSKIFGELMLLIEKDKRGEDFAIHLTYSQAIEKFFIPKNVFLIGTMNTADRSLALLDYALRRRFAFISTSPIFDDKFGAELSKKDVGSEMIERIQRNLTELNKEIATDHNLGSGFEIGHSYFCNVDDDMDDEAWYRQIIEQEIGPMLEEYWFDNPEKAESAKRSLLN